MTKQADTTSTKPVVTTGFDQFIKAWPNDVGPVPTGDMLRIAVALGRPGKVKAPGAESLLIAMALRANGVTDTEHHTAGNCGNAHNWLTELQPKQADGGPRKGILGLVTLTKINGRMHLSLTKAGADRAKAAGITKLDAFMGVKQPKAPKAKAPKAPKQPAKAPVSEPVVDQVTA